MKKFYILFLIILLIAGCTAYIVKENIAESAKNLVTYQNQVNINNSVTEHELVTYQNTEYGFSLNYPKGWLIKEFTKMSGLDADISISLVSPERQKRLEETGGYEMAEADINISVYKSIANLPNNAVKNLNFEEWLQTEVTGIGLFDFQATIFAGVPAFRGLSGSADEADPVIYLEHNEKVYILKNEIGDERAKVRNDKIIQTFKFTN